MILRLLITVLPALVAFFLVARAILDANESDWRYAIGLLVIFAASVALTARRMPDPPQMDRVQQGWRLLALIGPALLIYPFTVVVLIFGQVDMAAFVFHLIFGMDGTPWSDFAPYLATALVFWVIFCLSMWRARYWLEKVPASWLGIAGAVLAINPLTYDLAASRVSAQFSMRDSLTQFYTKPSIRQAANPPNLILVYVEGLERSYLERPELNGIMPELKALDGKVASLRGVEQVFGTGWSLAGNVATQCGVPILPLGARPLDQFSEVKEIIPHMVCLGDVLADLGYDQTYMSTAKILGNKMGYYGFDNFYSSHRFDTIIDRDIMLAELESQATRSEDDQGWGLYDGEMIEYALGYIEKKAKSDRPFAVVMATMDTHGPAGIVSPHCTDDGKGAVTDDIRDALACTSRLIDNFIAGLTQRIDLDNTKIVIMSDHLAHHNNLTPLLNEGPRRNLVLLLDDAETARLDAKASMFDIYPTLLDWMGLLSPKAPKAGLGVSLLSDAPTLVEQMGREQVDATLQVDVELARFIWR